MALMFMAACAGRMGHRADVSYAVPPVLDVTRLLSPPPVNEAARARDLAAVRAAQQARTAAQAEHAEASSAVDVFLFAAVLGPRFDPQRVPRTADFFDRVYRSALPYLQATKECWRRPRPFVADPTLEPLERALASTRLRSAPAPAQAAPQLPPADSPCTASVAETSYSPSYPSGHATVGAMMAILLAQMVPERRDALFALGWEYGEARVISGVHYPSDVEAGRILGTMLVGVMQENRRFRADFAVARRELRAVLEIGP
jgi:acid phosphatase (class A)